MSYHLAHEDHTYEGRVVFGGNDVWTQNRDVAILQELAPQPATLEASGAADAYGCLDCHTIEQADVEQAYVQALMNGTPTYVRLPRHQWLEEWEGNTLIPLFPSNSHYMATLTPESTGRKLHSRPCRSKVLKTLKTGKAVVGTQD